MKHILNRAIKNIKSVNGASLAEFATTTALMATLAATAAPKLSEMAEGSKQEKTMGNQPPKRSNLNIQMQQRQENNLD